MAYARTGAIGHTPEMEAWAQSGFAGPPPVPGGWLPVWCQFNPEPKALTKCRNAWVDEVKDFQAKWLAKNETEGPDLSLPGTPASPTLSTPPSTPTARASSMGPWIFLGAAVLVAAVAYKVLS